jgi:hypothetical protein
MKELENRIETAANALARNPGPALREGGG